MMNAIEQYRPQSADSGGIVLRPEFGCAIVPTLDASLTIRVGTRKDILFVDQMQKVFAGNLGFLYNGVIEKRLQENNVLIAEDRNGVPMGLCMGQSSYMTNDQCGIIFQLAVVPIKQRRQVGASLIREFFHRLPYGTKLVCCWCAQDLPANYFWEAMGFIPIAFRTGSRNKQRIHIFWQRRVRTDDHRTPFWFPKKTGNGSIAEDRLIVPMPPGTHWKDAKPVLLPDQPGQPGVRLLANGLPDPAAQQRKRLALPPASTKTPAERAAELRQRSKHLKGLQPGYIRIVSAGKVRTVPGPDYVPPPPPPPKPKRPRAKADKQHVEAARELRDRYLEQFNDAGIIETGKYDPTRQINHSPSIFGEFQCLNPMNTTTRSLPTSTPALVAESSPSASSGPSSTAVPARGESNSTSAPLGSAST